MKIIDYLLLPKTISDFEARYVARINRIAFVFFALHVPTLMLVAWGNGTKPWLAFCLAVATLVGPAVAQKTLRNPRTVSMVYGVTAMFFGGLLVHFGQGATQIEMHFYFFALLAMLAVFGNPMVIIAATVTVALHHLALWLILPKSVFNYAAPVWVVGLHALFVVLESVAVCFIARNFFDNVIGLEKIVDARTKELAARGAEMRRVLDNVDQGFVVVGTDLTLAKERSQAFDAWFGAEHRSLVEAFATRSKEFATNLSVAWDALQEGFLPAELLVEQLPKRLSSDGAHLDVEYLPVEDGTYLVVVTDVTARVEQELSDRERMETLAIFERVLSDRNAVDEFFRDSNELVREIAGGSSDLATFKRALHTLKGNSAMFGLHSVAEACHEIETWVAEEEGRPSPRVLAPLLDRWARVGSSISRVVRVRSNTVELDLDEHEQLEREAKTISLDFWKKVRDLKLEPTKRRLSGVAAHTKRIAERLDKDVDVRVEDNGLRTDPVRWSPFWGSFIHAVRNAVDHGAENADERLAAGKSTTAAITLRTVMRDDRFMIEIEDDGRGVDWERVKEKAASLGLPTGTQQELAAVLFADGFSTRDDVSDLSGRGVGMGALKAATESLGGVVEVTSQRGLGTTIRMSFPAASIYRSLRSLPPRAA